MKTLVYFSGKKKKEIQVWFLHKLSEDHLYITNSAIRISQQIKNSDAGKLSLLGASTHGLHVCFQGIPPPPVFPVLATIWLNTKSLSFQTHQRKATSLICSKKNQVHPVTELKRTVCLTSLHEQHTILPAGSDLKPRPGPLPGLPLGGTERKWLHRVQ